MKDKMESKLIWISAVLSILFLYFGYEAVILFEKTIASKISLGDNLFRTIGTASISFVCGLLSSWGSDVYKFLGEQEKEAENKRFQQSVKYHEKLYEKESQILSLTEKLEKLQGQ